MVAVGDQHPGGPAHRSRQRARRAARARCGPGRGASRSRPRARRRLARTSRSERRLRRQTTKGSASPRAPVRPMPSGWSRARRTSRGSRSRVVSPDEHPPRHRRFERGDEQPVIGPRQRSRHGPHGIAAAAVRHQPLPALGNAEIGAVRPAEPSRAHRSGTCHIRRTDPAWRIPNPSASSRSNGEKRIGGAGDPT